MKTRIIHLIFSFFFLPLILQAGVRKEVETRYEQEYENKAIFLKVPVRGKEQIVVVRDQGALLDQSNLGQPVTFKVGDQVRILDVRFHNDSVEFKLASVDMSQEAALLFQFNSPLTYSFYQQPAFDSALQDSLTEGISYREIDSAKQEFIRGQYDRLIEQFASTTGTSTDFVIKAISEKNPEFRAAKEEAAEALQRAAQLKDALDKEKKTTSEMKGDLAKLRSDLESAASASESLQRDKTQLVSERRRLQESVNRLEQANKDYMGQIQRLEGQINNIAAKLDSESASKRELGETVDSLTQSLDSLQSDRASLSQKLTRVSDQLKSLQQENQDLNQEVEDLERRNARIRSDLGALTSDRNSLEANFLRTRQEKEILERAEALQAGLQLEKQIQRQEGDTFLVATLLLLDQEIGTLRVERPQTVEDTSRIWFEVSSPDTVQFSDEQRELYQSLGEAFRVETTWEPWTDQLESVLLNGARIQEVAPREEGRWEWAFRGQIQEPERVTFKATLVNNDQQVIDLGSHQFEIFPAGLLSQAKYSFSWFSLILGFLAGAAIIGAGFALRGRQRQSRSGSAARRPQQYPAHKEL